MPAKDKQKGNKFNFRSKICKIKDKKLYTKDFLTLTNHNSSYISGLQKKKFLKTILSSHIRFVIGSDQAKLASNFFKQ